MDHVERRSAPLDRLAIVVLCCVRAKNDKVFARWERSGGVVEQAEAPGYLKKRKREGKATVVELRSGGGETKVRQSRALYGVGAGLLVEYR